MSFERDYHTESEMEKEMLEQYEQAREDDRVQREAVSFESHFLAGVSCEETEDDHGSRFVMLSAGPIRCGAMPGTEEAVCLGLTTRAINLAIRLERAGAVKYLDQLVQLLFEVGCPAAGRKLNKTRDIIADCLVEGE